MKTFFTYAVLLLTVLTFNNNNCFGTEIQDSSINVTYIGATGFLIESTNKKILIEPTYNDIVKNFGYAYSNDNVTNDIANGTGIFDSIDLILISHFHLGHLDPEKTIQCIKSNPDAILITTSDAFNTLMNATDDFAAIESQIFVPEIEANAMLDTVINEIPVKLTKVAHNNPTPATELLQYCVTMDNINMAFYLDFHEPIEGEEYHVKTKDINLAILDGNAYGYEDFRDMLKADFEIGYTLLTHSTNNTFMTKSIEENIDKFPNVNLIRNSMEKISFTFINDKVIVDTLNRAPTLVNLIENDTINTNEYLDYQFQSPLFEDLDGDEITITVTQANGNELPGWVEFNGSLMTLKGTPTEKQQLRLKVIATDSRDSYFQSSFKIVVLTPTSINERNLKQNNIEIYPNPVNGYINFDLTNSLTDYNKAIIYNESGKIICEKLITNHSINRINLTHLSNGLYIINLRGKEGIYNKQFIKY